VRSIKTGYGIGNAMVTANQTTKAEHLSAIPTATGGIARHAYARLKRSGIETQDLLEKTGLEVSQIEDHDLRIKVYEQIKFLDLAAKALNDRLLGFNIAREFDLRELGLLYYVMASSDNLGEALQRAARYSMIMNEGVKLIYQENKEVAMVFEYAGVARHPDRHQIEFFMTTLVRLCRQLTGHNLELIRVSLLHQRTAHAVELDKFFFCKVIFNGVADEFAFPGTVKTLPIASGDPYLNRLLMRYCEEARSAKLVRRGDFRLLVENAIIPLLPHGKAQVSKISRKLGLSKRTIARRLASEGVTFAVVLDSLRYELAKRYLQENHLAISEIAWLLGYRESSAFSHAFKRWDGRTPKELRSLGPIGEV
jgi:AraC-like DNA-binding protein